MLTWMTSTPSSSRIPSLFLARRLHDVADDAQRPGHADSADVGLLDGWRGQAAGSVLDDVLAGRRTVRVESVNGKSALRVGPVEGEAPSVIGTQ